MCYKGEIGNFSYEKQKDGTFLYKAKENTISSKKVNRKAQYKEKPQYKALEQIEQQSVIRFQDNLKSTVKNVVQLLNTIQNERIQTSRK